MTIKLNNIGMIKEANIKLDGLTVIAGENDTGKSTVGKALYALIKSNNIAVINPTQNSKLILATRLNLVFDGIISNKGDIALDNTSATIKDNNFVSSFQTSTRDTNQLFEAIFIQSPIVLDLTDFFNSVMKMNQMKKFDFDTDFEIKYPYMMYDLFYKISTENPFPDIKIQQKIDSIIKRIIKGEFIKKEGKFYYNKYLDGRKIEAPMINTAVGIKSFGILQLLNDNKYLNKKVVLILDEPEVHLHPKWQLKMAEVIVELVKNGVKIIVNSHSPYMIEALKRYSEVEKIKNKTNFYLAEDGYIKKLNDNNSETLMAIYEKLSEPYDTFEQMESDRFTNG